MRVRRSSWLMADLGLSSVTVTIICLNEILLAAGQGGVPCGVLKAASGLHVVSFQSLLVWRGLQLW